MATLKLTHTYVYLNNCKSQMNIYFLKQKENETTYDKFT